VSGTEIPILFMTCISRVTFPSAHVLLRQDDAGGHGATRNDTRRHVKRVSTIDTTIRHASAALPSPARRTGMLAVAPGEGGTDAARRKDP
jgi:hypothetical protein